MTPTFPAAHPCRVSIRAPREGGDMTVPGWSAWFGVSIRAPREGGDKSCGVECFRDLCFNPRPPRRGRYFWMHVSVCLVVVSIRAPREGGDFAERVSRPCWKWFQSAPPAKGAICRRKQTCASVRFQSAPPAKGAITRSCSKKDQGAVSIRAPREGGDIAINAASGPSSSFNPRPPRRGRWYRRSRSLAAFGFNPRPPRRGRSSLRQRSQP